MPAVPSIAPRVPISSCPPRPPPTPTPAGRLRAAARTALPHHCPGLGRLLLLHLIPNLARPGPAAAAGRRDAAGAGQRGARPVRLHRGRQNGCACWLWLPPAGAGRRAGWLPGVLASCALESCGPRLRMQWRWNNWQRQQLWGCVSCRAVRCQLAGSRPQKPLCLFSVNLLPWHPSNRRPLPPCACRRRLPAGHGPLFYLFSCLTVL